MKTMLSFAITILFFWVSLCNSFCKNGTQISGFIFDANTGEKISSANVIVVDTKFGAASNTKGKYKISHLNVGTYTVQCKKIGYRSITVDSVLVRKNQSTEITFVLSPVKIEGISPVVVGFNSLAKIKRKMTSIDPNFAIIGDDSMDRDMVIAADPSVDPGILINPSKSPLIGLNEDSLKSKSRKFKSKRK